jgi:hypothetical protein
MDSHKKVVKNLQVSAPVVMDLVDPDGVNPQRLVDVMNDLQAEVEMGTGKARATIGHTKKLLDKHLSIIVDTQTLKSGGLPGPKGPAGRKGYPGYQGAVGAEGDRGPTGNVGAQGAKGYPGPQGLRGKIGNTGPEGNRGVKGVVGPQGFPGPPGPRGQLGTPGPRGPRGARGGAGYKGLRGAQVWCLVWCPGGKFDGRSWRGSARLGGGERQVAVTRGRRT